MGQDIFSEQDWNEYASCYNALLQLEPYQQLIRDVISHARPNAHDVILDAGCGTGNLLQALRASHPKAELHGVDLSQSMLSLAARSCAGKRVQLLRSSLDETLPFADEMFTKIVSVNVLYALPDPLRTLRELNRVLKQGGMLVIETPKRGYDNGLVLKAHCANDLPDSYWADAHSSPQREELLVRTAICDSVLAEQMLKIASHNRKIAHTAIFHFFNEEEFTALLEASGFTLRSLRPAYAQQGMLAVAQKERTYEKH